MTAVHRTAILLAVLLGAAGALVLFRTQRDPCGALLRRYGVAYEARRACRADADCVVDPLPPAGPGVCDRARAAASDRVELDEVERAWAAAGCPAPGAPCPPDAGARCVNARCATLRAR